MLQNYLGYKMQRELMNASTEAFAIPRGEHSSSEVFGGKGNDERTSLSEDEQRGRVKIAAS